MRWKGGEESENVEDRRGMRVPGGAKGVGIGAIIVAVIAVLMGGDPSQLLGLLAGGGGAGVAAGEEGDEQVLDDVLLPIDRLADFAEDPGARLADLFDSGEVVIFEGG